MAIRLSQGFDNMESKRIKVSEKRQITIPIKFYEKLNIGNEVECIFDEDSGFILIRPSTKDDDFSEVILADLINQGYSGSNLLKEFKRIKKGIRQAVEDMIEDADKAAAVRSRDTSDKDIKDIFKDVLED